MSKVINLSVDCCIKCPYCTPIVILDVPFSELSHVCRETDMTVSEGKLPTADMPIPTFCPLPNGNDLMYFVVRESMEEVSDDWAIPVKSIDTIKLGSEKHIVNSWEETAGIALVDNIEYVAEGNNGWTPEETKPHKIAVILGRVLTKDEVDLKRGS